jgi:hypothetical protein
MAYNRFEEVARAAKVDNLLITARARKITAARVANEDDVRNMLICNTPGVTSASDETWRCLVAALHGCEELDALYAAGPSVFGDVA